MPTLRFHRADELIAEHRLRSSPVTIGRADSCDMALPGETLSRVHCIVQCRDGQWEVVDRSRHGITLDGAPVDRRASLNGGAWLEMGPYRVQFAVESTAARPTALQEPDRAHERIIAADRGLTVERAALVLGSGPTPGRRFDLRSTRSSVGGEGSDIVIPGGSLAKDHCWIRVSRGRAMVEPGRGATLIDGERVREITPLYLEEEFTLGDVVLRVTRDLSTEAPTASRFGEMVGQSRPMQQLFGTLRRMAGHHYTVLVIGESGTGKELVARGIHEHSARAERPFVALNCGAITDALFESELFGHEKGAFTGADRRKAGAFHEADGGTLFLDEVGELPESAQAKLLRALETGEVRRVGSAEVEYPDVRVVAATNRDLAVLVRAGRFREDLYFRLAVLSVRVPPLRDRPGDIEILCKALCARLHPEARVTSAALRTLATHSWPGNVRELRNVLTRAYVLGGPRIDDGSVTFHDLGPLHRPIDPLQVSQDESERDYLIDVLRRNGENRSAAARELGVARSTMLYKLKKHGLS